MNMFAKFVIGGIVVGFALFVYDMASQYLRGRAEPTMLVELKADEVSTTVISPARIETLERTEGGGVKHTTEPNYHRGYEVKVSKTGSVKVLQKSRGFGDDFGLSTDFHHVGVALEPFYYKQVHGLVGTHFIDLRNSRLVLNLYVALAYRIPFPMFNNVSVFGGFSTDQKAIGGLFIRFGSN